MVIDSINYIFGTRDSESVALNISAIYRNLGYKGIDKSKICEIYNINNLNYNNMENTIVIKNAVQDKILKDKDKIEHAIKVLEEMWNSVKKGFFSCVGDGLDIRVNSTRTFNTYCYLQALPINELDRDNNVIYLDYNRPIDELFKNFIVLVAKSILLDKWDDMNGDIFSHSYQSQNKIWLFADIAVDAVFASTDLCKLCDKPSYRYFYNSKINDIPFMYQFRQLYKMVTIEEFLNQVYLFVYHNHTELIKFKNYLY